MKPAPLAPELALEVRPDDFVLSCRFGAIEAEHLERGIGHVRARSRDICRHIRNGGQGSGFKRINAARPVFEMGQVPRPQVVMVGDDPQLPPRPEHPPRLGEKSVLDDSFLVVAPLGPRVGKVQVNHPDDPARTAPPQKLARIAMEHAHIGELSRLAAPPNSVGCVGVKLVGPLDPEEVGPRLEVRLLKQKSTLARADLDLEGSARLGEPRPGVHPPGFWVLEDGIGQLAEFFARDTHNAYARVNRSSVSKTK
jgi:hypothetical protein